MVQRRRLLGIDYGDVRIGLAVSDADRVIASPLAQYQRRSAEEDAHYLRQLIETEEIGGIVLGLPIHLSGHEGSKAAQTRKFGSWLEQVTGLPVVYWDERFTTLEAERSLWDAGLTHRRRRQRRDMIAAQIILQSYLDAGAPTDVKLGPLDD
ncbi:MAG: putative pre-16S rRNA nuclease [Gemmatales bacterium]|nr:MAG: putative pre-16S rRNA nuclease [Gemmatales bacterium]